MNAPDTLAPPSRAPAGELDDFPDSGDYAAIGNCRTVALVSRGGAILGAGMSLR
jgi:hypothetical protein